MDDLSKMKRYLSVDGGGTKLRAIAFDETFRILGEGESGGVNTNFIPRERVQEHMQSCITDCLGEDPFPIDCAFLTIVGPAEDFVALLRKKTPVYQYRLIGEAHAYLLSGLCTHSALVALAGTGSGAAWIEQGETLLHLGGYGGYIGDEGSGYTIGRMAINAACRFADGWGEATTLRDALYDYLGISHRRAIIPGIYRHPEGVHRAISGFCPYVGMEAEAGDPIALGIVKSNARNLAHQVNCLRQAKPFYDGLALVRAGGVFKGTHLFTDAFNEELGRIAPEIRSHTALFEPVMAGVVLQAIEQGLSPHPQLTQRFSQYLIQPQACQ